MNRSPSQRGSAIIMLFIAVALFGMLTFAFTRGSGNSVAMMSDEQAKVYAQQIIAYGNDVKTAVKRLQLRGVADNQINFYNPIYKTTLGVLTTTNNPNSTSASQNIYDVSGGGLTPLIIPKSAMSTTVRGNNADYGHYYFRSVEIVGTKTSANDVVLFLEGVDPKVCKKINEILVPGTAWPAPWDDQTGWGLGNDVYNFAGSGIIGDEATFIQGKKSFCFGIHSTSATNYPHYLQVLVDR